MDLTGKKRGRWEGTRWPCRGGQWWPGLAPLPTVCGPGQPRAIIACWLWLFEALQGQDDPIPSRDQSVRHVIEAIRSAQLSWPSQFCPRLVGNDRPEIPAREPNRTEHARGPSHGNGKKVPRAGGFIIAKILNSNGR
ncbi:hypothetical protein GGTG_11634 [Gaeumannomyces tritici R3-111a-1]|uniref:Uncharacterized protein n=1 Tax=Gaeumannomyces tritici (strain R3-111a-1) TaxID=644352 RepID=J3PDR1_GAET3|nr:hypothetical protein GGTG_11634 [Gaeumannomyces tritici R3-111a-1]EJT70611.1 hypothetical protein GGTG_11634 [Gaeumannomyces tritici R3-111a-1]